MAGNGQGSVYEVAGRRLPWCATVTVGWRLDGRPVRRSRYAASRDAALAELRDMLGASRDGLPLGDSRITVRRLMTGWLASRTDVRATTLRTWRQGADNICRALGTRTLRDLAPSDVEAALATMSPWAARSARAVLAAAIRDAERDGRVRRNVARLARSPRVTRTDFLVPGPDEARRLIAAAAAHRLGAVVVVALGTAMRSGELLGLTRDCLDLDAGMLRVEWSLAWIDGEPILGRPKTAAGRRVVLLPPFVVEVLRAHLARQAAERLAAGRAWRDADGLVFTTRTGRPVSPETIRAMLNAMCREAGLPHVRIHALRHAALTLVTERAGQKAAQVAAGHRSIAMTDAYAHPTDALGRAASAALEEALGGA